MQEEASRAAGNSPHSLKTHPWRKWTVLPCRFSVKPTRSGFSLQIFLPFPQMTQLRDLLYVRHGVRREGEMKRRSLVPRSHSQPMKGECTT